MDASFSFSNSKNMSNTELSSYFRSEAVKFESMEKISEDKLKSLFSESLKFYSRNLDKFQLNDLVYLIRNCWHENPRILWGNNSDQIINMSKENINGMTIVASISAFTSDMENANINQESKDFFQNFIHESFTEINENCENIENQNCDSFVVFNIILTRAQILQFLFELVQAIPYSDTYISKYLPYLREGLPSTSIYTLYSFFIANNLIQILPRSIFLDKNFLEFTNISNSLILLNKTNEEEFLSTFPWFYQKINDNESNNSHLSYSFLEHLSRTNSEQIVNFMNKNYSEGKNRIQKIIDFASDCEFSTKLLLNLRQYKFRLPENVSKKISTLDEDPEYLSIISSNPLLYMDRSQLEPVLLFSEDPLVYNNLFRSYILSDPIFKDLKFWSHVIPLSPKINESSINSLFIRVDPNNVSARITELFLFNYPQNMKPAFFDFAKCILEQDHDFASFSKSDETRALLSQIDSCQPLEFWKLFVLIEPIISIINNNFESHLALSLGLASLSIYQYKIRASPPDPQIKVFKISQQTEESIKELHLFVDNKPDWKSDFSSLSRPALSVATAANLFSSNILNKFIEFKIEGLTDEIFLPFISIVVNNLSFSNRDYRFNENNLFQFNQYRQELPLNAFLNKSDFSKKMINFLKSINLENPNNNFIEMLLNIFIKLNGDIWHNYREIIIKILKIFSANLTLYFDPISPFAKLMSQFFGRLLKDNFNRSSGVSEFRSIMTQTMQAYVIRLLIAYPCEYSSSFFDTKVLERVIKEEKEKDNHNSNIILFLVYDLRRDRRNTKPVFNSDEISYMINHTIEEKNFKLLRTIINYSKNNFLQVFVPLLEKKIPIDIKITILSKMIPIEGTGITNTFQIQDARRNLSFETLISIIKENDNMRILKEQLSVLCFYFILESPLMIDYFLVLFEKQFDYNPFTESYNIKFNSKLNFSEFSIAFKKSFQILKNDKNGCIVKRPYKPELEQPTEFSLQFVNMLIDDFINHPTWQVLTILYSIASNLPFLFLFIDRIDTIFKNLFELFKIFEKYQEIPLSQKEDQLKKHKSPMNTNNSNNSQNDENDEDNNNIKLEINDETDDEIKNLTDLFYAACSGIYFLGSLVSIPKIADKFFHFSLSNFLSFSDGQITSFISILIPIINRETAQHVAVSYFIRYDWILLLTIYYKNVDRPISKFSRYVLANLLYNTYEYFIKYIHLLTPELAATCDELTKLDNPFEVSFDYKTQISPIFIPCFTIKKHELKQNLYRNVIGLERRDNSVRNYFFGNRLNPNRNNRTNFLLGRPNLNDQEDRLSDNSEPVEDLSTLDLNPTTSNTNTTENTNNETDNANNNENGNNPNESSESTNNNSRETRTDPQSNYNRSQTGQPRERLLYHNSFDIGPPRNRIVPLDMPFHAFPRANHDNVLPQPLSRFDLLHHLFMNNFDHYSRKFDDPSNFLSFWSIFHLTDDETQFVRRMAQISDKIFFDLHNDTKVSSIQKMQLLSDPLEQVDLSLFSQIQNINAFQQIDPLYQAIILRNEIQVPTKLTPQIQRYLISQPQWITTYISKPPQIILSAQHYSILQTVISKIKQIAEDEGEVTEETDSSKEFLESFISDIHSKSHIMIKVFLSRKFTLPYKIYTSFKKTLKYKELIFKSMTGILRILASENDEILRLILEKINKGLLKLDPNHIEHLVQILVSLSKLYKKNTNRYFSMPLFQRLTQIVGSPEIRSQSTIIEVTARLMVDLSKCFYDKKDDKSISIYSEIETNTLQIFSILLNSPNIQIVNKAMKLIIFLKDEVKSKLTSIILSRFDSIYTKIDKNDNDELNSFLNTESISTFLSEFISKFPELVNKRKNELLSILQQALQLKKKNISLISHLIDSLCPKRTTPNQDLISRNCTTNGDENKDKDGDESRSDKDIDKNEDNFNNEKENGKINEEEEEVDFNDENENSNENTQNNNNRKQILIPLVYYKKWPEFWEIIFENLSWFQEYVNNHQASIDSDFKFLKTYMELLTFKQKCVFFRKDQFTRKINHTKFELSIRRSEILTDSFYKLRSSSKHSKKNILSNIHIKFENEPGFDMGGLTRDWFTSLVKELFNPNYALFKLSENHRSYQPNPSSSINPYHLQYFEFAGLIIARAIIGGICVDAHLTPSFIKQILGVELSLRDLQDVDKDLYKNLKWLLNHDIEDKDDLGLRFTTGFTDIDTTKIVELKENGDNIVVNDENKKEYVKRLCQHIMKGQIEDQIEAFLKGFHSLIPRDEITLFTPTELDLLICGVPEIDVDDLKRNCDFSPPYSRDHPTIKMLFDVISRWGHEDLAKLLLFITGSSQVPPGGFKMLKESNQPIIIAPGGEDSRLPQAHTCMNTLDLPNYKNEKVLEEKLLLSISECNGFGFN